MSQTSSVGRSVEFILEAGCNRKTPSRKATLRMLAGLPSRRRLDSYCKRHQVKIEERFGVSGTTDEVMKKCHRILCIRHLLPTDMRQRAELYKLFCQPASGLSVPTQHKEKPRPRPIIRSQRPLPATA